MRHRYHRKQLTDFDTSMRDRLLQPNSRQPPMLSYAPMPLLPHRHGTVRVQTQEHIDAFQSHLSARQLQVLQQAQAAQMMLQEAQKRDAREAAAAAKAKEEARAQAAAMEAAAKAKALEDERTAGGFIYEDDDGHSSDGAGDIVARAIATQQHARAGGQAKNLRFAPTRVRSALGGYITTWLLVPDHELERRAMERAGAV